MFKEKKTLLITGGAGYIGSAMVLWLLNQGYICVVYDKVQQPDYLKLPDVYYYQANLSYIDLLEQVFQQHRPWAILHFAGLINVNESLIRPAQYYQANICIGIELLNLSIKYQVGRFIFSSTAAVYGIPQDIPISESHSCLPISPYGRTKLHFEQILKDYFHAYGMKSVSLRYFNAAGAHPQNICGENHSPETHLIPLTLQVASGRRSYLTLYGADYPTPDGTCLRDYIHIQDLCEAHYAALLYLDKEQNSTSIFNLGAGKAYSIKDIIRACEAVTGQHIPVKLMARREGDPPILLADIQQAKQQLAWTPSLSDLEIIIQHAWAWEQKISGLVIEKSSIF